ncbi:putative membrane protein [Geothermobacter ehrlichii]|uniref:Putative membrane protein n=1 Tax=Geothermobacter ehrlichii TaxID=213224 RepID=A0A5D3WKY9_9BACT|nr:DUF2270 domain-containing protein [Geothermobacter ehrlichii]TYO99320.1 putative membrane protein [Geothermobacter ehrlichii]
MPESMQESQPLSRSEQITAISHYYRAEVQRSLAWRERLDRTTNWAGATATAFLAFGFSHPEIHHSIFAFGYGILFILLFIEARRFRFFDAYEYRVRLLNQYFIYDILAHGSLPTDFDQEDRTYWRAELASDLRYPQYKMGLRSALCRRLRANYVYFYVLLVCAWMVKVWIHPQVARSWDDFLRQGSIGDLPGTMVLLLQLVFVACLLWFSHLGRRSYGGRDMLHTK